VDVREGWAASPVVYFPKPGVSHRRRSRRVSERKILIVEDEAVVAMELKTVLQMLGYTVCGTVSRGNDAIRIAKETWPDLILMDIHLQGPMDGIEAAEKINAFYDIPVLFLTAYSDDRTVERVINTRSYGYLVKPFNDRELYTNIEMAIRQHHSTKKNRVDEKIIDSTFSLVSDAIITTSRTGRVKQINAGAENLTGWTNDEMAGRYLWEVIGADDGELKKFIESVQLGTKENEPVITYDDPLIIRTKMGTERKVSASVELIRGQYGILQEMILVLARKGTEDEDTGAQIPDLTTKMVLDVFDDPVFFIDTTQRVVLHNTALHIFCSGAGMDVPLVNRQLYDIFPPSLIGDPAEYDDLFSSGKPDTYVTPVRIGNRDYTLKIEKLPVYHKDKVSHVATIIRDVTSRIVDVL
jgi:PAS domain S-box-containing protein